MTKFTDEQILSAYEATHSISAAAKALGADRRGLARRLRTLAVVDHSEPRLSTEPRRHIVIPDCQVKPGVPIDYLHWVGAYIQDQAPDVVVQIGDFADFPSLSSYDIGKRSFEGRQYKADVKAANEALRILTDYCNQTQADLHFTAGNHENRCNRAVENDRKLEGMIDWRDVGFDELGWKTHDFLEPVMVDGICYSHYFTSGVMGRPVSSARALLNKKHMSCVMGHVQRWEMHRDVRADGSAILGLFAGSCYLHDEDYLGPQGNQYWRGIWVLNEVEHGDFQPMPVSLNYLKRKYQ
jgi:hypothetical protein